MPRGLPTPGVPTVDAGDLTGLFTAGAALALVGLAEGLSAARLFAARGGYRIDADQELVASGAANVACGLFGGLGVAGSLSKTAAVSEARGRTQVAGLAAAALALLVIVAIAPALSALPRAVLSAIVVNAVWKLMDFPALRRYARVRRNDIVAAVVAGRGRAGPRPAERPPARRRRIGAGPGLPLQPGRRRDDGQGARREGGLGQASATTRSARPTPACWCSASTCRSSGSPRPRSTTVSLPWRRPRRASAPWSSISRPPTRWTRPAPTRSRTCWPRCAGRASTSTSSASCGRSARRCGARACSPSSATTTCGTASPRECARHAGRMACSGCRRTRTAPRRRAPPRRPRGAHRGPEPRSRPSGRGVLLSLRRHPSLATPHRATAGGWSGHATAYDGSRPSTTRTWRSSSRTMPALPIAHPWRGASSGGSARCSWFDQRAPAASTVTRWRQVSRPARPRSVEPVPPSTARSQASARTPAVPQHRPLLSQKPGRSRSGSPDPEPCASSGPGAATSGVGRQLVQQAEDLRVAGRPVAPAVAVALDPVGLLLRVGVRDQEPRLPGLVARDHVGDAGQREVHQVVRGRSRPRWRPVRARRRGCRARCGDRRAAMPARFSQVTPCVGDLGGPQVGRRGQLRQLQVAGRSAPRAMPALPPISSNYRPPPLAVERPHGPARARRGLPPQHRRPQPLGHGVQGERHPGGAEVERRVAWPSTPARGPGLPAPPRRPSDRHRSDGAPPGT